MSFDSTETILNIILLHYHAFSGMVACDNVMHHVMGDDNIVPLVANYLVLEKERISMLLDPKKNYPSVRVRVVDYKTKVMTDISMPSEYFTEDELSKIKAQVMNVVGLDIRQELIDAAAESEQSVEENMFKEEERDGDD